MTAAKNAIVSWPLNFRIRMFVKSAVNYFEVYPEIATLPKIDMKAEISELQPGIILFVTNIASATGFESHAMKLFNAASQVQCYSVNSLRTWE